MIALAHDELAEPILARRTKRAVRWLIAFWLLLVTLTHFPNPYPGLSEPRHIDKLVHFSLYCTLAVLALRARSAWTSARLMLVNSLAVFAAVTAFGLLDEATQPLTGRDFDWFDWLADGVGAMAGILIYEAVRRRTRLPNDR